MRDHIKDKEYFELYLKRVITTIKEFDILLKKVIQEKGESYAGVRNGYLALEKYNFDLINALYSSGADIQEIKKIYPKYQTAIINTWTISDGFESLLNVVSLLVLLSVSETEKEKMMSFLRKLEVKDTIIDCVAHDIDPQWLIKNNHILYPARYKKLGEIIKSKDEMKQIELLKEYLDEWYNKHKDASWYDSHKSKQDIYRGYWCFEAGAIAKILGIDDKELKNVKYYPYDLVHFKDE